MAKSQKTNGGLGYSLTSDYYTDPAIFAAERERIFFRPWQRVGHAEQSRRAAVDSQEDHRLAVPEQ